MAPSHLASWARRPSGRRPAFTERQEIALLRAQGHGARQIARRIGCAGSPVSRELRGSAAARSGGLEHRATAAQRHAERAGPRPRPTVLERNAGLRRHVEDRLAVMIIRPDGRPARELDVPSTKRRSVRRRHRRWGKAWSPERIPARLRGDFLEDETMRVSHEAIHRSLRIQCRGELRRDLGACLRSGRALRGPRARRRSRCRSFAAPEVMMSERPAEGEDRAAPGRCTSTSPMARIRRVTTWTNGRPSPPRSTQDPARRRDRGRLPRSRTIY